ncbi:MAG: putative bifunctional diguanylate cyclase/phosphodiesterase [Lysobacteraceae bacterium]|jgi:diguanylate cyclase (GGDEF)-like protein|nr:EAL domain-containing protein [Xanthomonadaceae bacterium]
MLADIRRADGEGEGMAGGAQGVRGAGRLDRLRGIASGLGARLIALMLVASTAITFGVALTEVLADYRADVKELDADLERIGRANLDPIALSLWNYDDAQLKLQLDGILQRPYVAAVEVRERGEGGADGAVRARVGEADRPGLRAERMPLVYRRDGEDAPLGTLRILLDQAAMQKVARDRAVNILLTQGSITLLIGLALLLIVRQIITRHLSALAKAATAFDLRDPSASFRVRRRRHGRGDEIDRVIDALEVMRTSLHRAYRDLEDANAELQADIAARLRAEATADHLANHDALTNLPNRRLLYQRLAHELAVAERSGTMGAMMFIDLDHFKTLNDARGHSIGDAVLIEMARRLKSSLREIDLVARLGGDEFVALLPMLGELRERVVQNARIAAEKLRAAVAEPIVVRGEVFRLSASIGVTVFPESGGTPEDLIKHADTAMYQAKSEGRNIVHFFQHDLLKAMEERHALESDLRQALEDGALDVAYQPLIDIRGTLCGAEALVRWTHPQRGPVSPAQFIPLCEESGLIVQIGDWVLRAVLRQVRTWRTDGLLGPDQYVSVNISPRQFRQQGFEDQLMAALHEAEVPPSALVLEITEGVVLGDIDSAIERMQTLRGRGVRFFIDDFGTGYSSMAYLKRLPADGLKIDKTFVRDLGSDADDAAIVDAILAMGRHFGLTVVAEGVETAAQAEYLAARQCAVLQGYHLGRPAVAARFAESFLRRRTLV